MHIRQPRVHIRLNNIKIRDARRGKTTTKVTPVEPDTEPDTAPDETEEQTLSGTLIWGEEYYEGEIITYNSMDYRVMQDTIASESYPPDADAMLAIYAPYQGDEDAAWLYGEYVVYLTVRIYNGVRYVCNAANAGANITTPDIATSVWITEQTDCKDE